MKKWNFVKQEWIDSSDSMDVRKFDLVYASPTAGKTTLLRSCHEVNFFDSDWVIWGTKAFEAMRRYHMKVVEGDKDAVAIWDHLKKVAWNYSIAVHNECGATILTNLNEGVRLLKHYHNFKSVAFFVEPDQAKLRLIRRIEEGVEQGSKTREEADKQIKLLDKRTHWLNRYSENVQSGKAQAEWVGARADLYLLQEGDYLCSAFGIEAKPEDKEYEYQHGYQIWEDIAANGTPMVTETFVNPNMFNNNQRKHEHDQIKQKDAQGES